MSDNLIERAKEAAAVMNDCLVTIEVRHGAIAAEDAYRAAPGLVLTLVTALARARSYRSLPPGMVWQDYYSPDDVCKIREPLDAEIERLRAAAVYAHDDNGALQAMIAERDHWKTLWEANTGIAGEAMRERDEANAEVERLRAGGPWVEHVETARALQESHHGGCICDCNPETTNGPEEYCSHHGRPYYEAVDRLTAEIDRLVQERLTFTDKLGYGDGVTEPAAELADLIDPIKAAFSEARDHNECPRICEPCGERLASTVCPECRGSGCHAAMCEASGAYRECEYCAGVGWVHEGCVEQSYADLAAKVGKLGAALESIRERASEYYGPSAANAEGRRYALADILVIVERLKATDE